MSSWEGSACYPRSTFYPLSDGPSTRGRRITRADFRPCSACLPRSQARLCSCAPRTVADRPERTLRAPPLLFRRRPPQSNCPPDTVLIPAYGTKLESQRYKGGIPTVTPRILAYSSLCLPPILYMQRRNSISSYSKAPRGLSVLLRVTGIFTGTTISPSPLLRQCPDHYAFRAGRNLPDKEFRYLRTVIVTAAVYWGLSSVLLLTNDTFP